jgi:hypothetical protein
MGAGGGKELTHAARMSERVERFKDGVLPSTHGTSIPNGIQLFEIK